MSGRRWTPDELEQLRAHWSDWGIRRLAIELKRSETAILVRGERLGLALRDAAKPEARAKARPRLWTQEEIDLLQAKWGTWSISRFAERLGRSELAIKQKALKLRLGCYTQASDMISLSSLIQLVYGYNKQGSVYYKLDQWVRAGIPARRQLIQHGRILMIRLDKFWAWAERHQDIVNLSRLEEGALGVEPAWARERRRIDRMNPVQGKRPWTREEDELLRALLAEYRLTYFELAKRINRSESAIKRRIYDLGIKAWPLRGRSRHWTDHEIATLREMRDRGYAMALIAHQLQRSEQSCRGMLERIERTKEEPP